MKRSPKGFLLSIIMICAFLTLGFIFYNEAHTETYSKALTVKEAYFKALERAKEWDKNAELESITSVDGEGKQSNDSKGKRMKWNINFAVPTKDKSLLISISENEITNFIEGKDNIRESEIIYSDELVLDSPEVLKKTKEAFNLLPGKVWAKGYHYTLHKVNGQVHFTVVGLSKNNYFANITWNSKNGELINGVEKLPKGGGAFIVNNKSKSPILKTMGTVDGIAASDNNSIIISWGYNFVNTVSPPELPFLKFSRDGGNTWSEFELPNKDGVKEAWIAEVDESVYIASNHDLLLYNYANLEELLSVPSPIIDLYHNKNEIFILTNEKIFRSNDSGINWTTIPAPEKSNSILQIKETIFTLTEEGKVLMNKDEKWKTITSEKEVVTDLLIYQNGIVATFGDGAVREYDIHTEEWASLFLNHNPPRRLFSSEGTVEREHFYTVTVDNKLYKHFKGGEGEWQSEEIIIFDEGYITDVVTRGDNIFVSLSPTFEWKAIKTKKGGS